MCRLPLDINDVQPKPMQKYKANNGWHFNPEAVKFAVSLMKKRNPVSKKEEPIEPMNKKQVDELLSKHGITVENKNDCDYIYVANMCKADYLGSSIIDEKHMAMYIKDTMEDPDSADGVIMRQWWAKMIACGQPVPWAMFLGDEEEEDDD